MTLKKMKKKILKTVKNIYHLFKRFDSDSRYFDRIREMIPELQKYKYDQKDYFIERAQEEGLNTLKEYHFFLKGHPEKVEQLRKHLTYSGSHFFRGEDWTFFTERVLSQFRNRKNVRVWCAGCSTGQEVYSLIMSLLNYVSLDAIDLLASDYNDELLDICKKGNYAIMHYHEIPEEYQKYTTVIKNRFVFAEELRKIIKTDNINLLTDDYPEGFDIILCRNVIKFFLPSLRLNVQKKFASSLNDGGILFLSYDDGNDDEMIEDPGKLGFRQISDRGIYQKATTADRRNRKK